MGKRAIVLAGGGSRGAYQIGVWTALRELGIDYQIVTGTSVGALNGALMVQGDYEEACALWENITEQAVIKAPELLEENAAGFMTFIKDVVSNGGVDISPLEEIMHTLIEEERFRRSEVDYALVTVEYPTFQAKRMRKNDIPKGQVVEYMLASAACFPAFKTRSIGETKYIDGGYHDNLPINLAIEMGADEIIAVDLESIGIVPKVQGKYKKITYIRSYWHLGQFLLFEKEQSKRNMALGYLDTKRAFHKLSGWGYAFTPDSAEENTRVLFPPLMKLMASMDMSIDNGLKAPINKVLRYQLMKTLQQKRVFNRKALGFCIVTAAAEVCGTVLNVDPTRAYTFEEFNESLGKVFCELEADMREKFGTVLKDVKTPKQIIKLLQQFERSHVVGFFYHLIRQFEAGNQKSVDLVLLATALPSEFIAALYLVIVKK